MTVRWKKGVGFRFNTRHVILYFLTKYISLGAVKNHKSNFRVLR